MNKKKNPPKCPAGHPACKTKRQATIETAANNLQPAGRLTALRPSIAVTRRFLQPAGRYTARRPSPQDNHAARRPLDSPRAIAAVRTTMQPAGHATALRPSIFAAHRPLSDSPQAIAVLMPCSPQATWQPSGHPPNQYIYICIYIYIH